MFFPSRSPSRRGLRGGRSCQRRLLGNHSFFFLSLQVYQRLKILSSAGVCLSDKPDRTSTFLEVQEEPAWNQQQFPHFEEVCAAPLDGPDGRRFKSCQHRRANSVQISPGATSLRAIRQTNALLAPWRPWGGASRGWRLMEHVQQQMGLHRVWPGPARPGVPAQTAEIW